MTLTLTREVKVRRALYGVFRFVACAILLLLSLLASYTFVWNLAAIACYHGVFDGNSVNCLSGDPGGLEGMATVSSPFLGMLFSWWMLKSIERRFRRSDWVGFSILIITWMAAYHFGPSAYRAMSQQRKLAPQAEPLTDTNKPLLPL
jgi:hypothetical protein